MNSGRLRSLIQSFIDGECPGGALCDVAEEAGYQQVDELRAHIGEAQSKCAKTFTARFCCSAVDGLALFVAAAGATLAEPNEPGS